MRRLIHRAQFLKAARGRRSPRRGFVLQAAPSPEGDPGLGFTVTRRAGNAVERNRIRRRLKAAAQLNAGHFRAWHDYVLIGRRDALHEPFDRIVSGVASALEQAHAGTGKTEHRRTR